MEDHSLTAPASASPTTEGNGEPAPIPAAGPGGRLDLSQPAWRLVLWLAWPTLVQQLLVLAVTLSDRMLVGRFQRVAADEQLATQAAQTTANYLSWFVSSYTVLVSVGSTALVARFTGAGDRHSAVRVTNQSLLLAAALGLLGSGVGLAVLPLMVQALQLRGEASAFAIDYLRPLFALLVFQVVEAAGIACLVGAGDTRTGLWVLGGVALVNLPLAYGLFLGAGPIRGFGFRGVALGTALSHALGALAVLAVLARGRAGLRLDWQLLRPDPGLIRRVLRVSVPAAADSLSVATGQLCFIGIVNRLGDAPSGAHGIALGWEALGYLPGMAFGTAAITLVGQGLGAGRPERAARFGWTAFFLGAAVMSLMGVVFFVLAGPMFRLFCPEPSQQPIVDAGVPVLRLIAFSMPLLASCIVFTYALRGAGDTRVPVLFTWLGFFVVRIPLAVFLTRPEWGLGLLGAWLAMFADIVVRGIFFLLRFAGGRWQTVRV